jgi:molybdopterin-containing oxidoreductase family iron-sulfur binding subunit
MQRFEFDRRDFLKSLGIIGGTAVAACNPMAPEEMLSAYLAPPVEMVPGVAAHFATVCRACPAGCGLVVRTREARPVKLEGNPAHPVNRGALCARGQALIQGLYGPRRVRRPLVRKSGELTEVSWDEAVGLVAGKLEKARATALLTGLDSGTFEDLIADFTRAFPRVTHVIHEPGIPTSMAQASSLLFGRKEIPRIDLSSVGHIVSFGADFLDAWVSPVELSAGWAARHGMAADRQLELDYIGPRRNLTAVAADRYLPATVAECGQLALMLLHEIYDRRRPLLARSTALTAIDAALRRLGPRPAGDGERAQAVEGLADRLLEAKTGLVLYGGAEVTGQQSTGIHAVVLLMNYLVGAVGGALRFGHGYGLSQVDPDSLAIELIDAAASGSIDVLFVAGADPVSTLPGAAAVGDKLARAGLVVALACEESDTTAAADVVLPVHHPLESWGDYQVAIDVAGLMQPVRAPLHDSRHLGDLLIELAGKAGKRLAHERYKDYLIARWTRSFGTAVPLPQPDPDAGPPPEPRRELATESWEQMLVAGGSFESGKRLPTPGVAPVVGAQLPRIEKTGKVDGAELIVPLSNLLHDGRSAGQDWLREVPCPLIQVAWDIPAELAEDVAAAAGVSDGDLVRLTSDHGEVTVTAAVESGLAPGTVALRAGGGRAGLRHGESTANPLALLGTTTDPLSGELARAGTRVELVRVKRGSLASAMGSPRSEGRLLALSMSLADARAGRFPVMTRHGEVPAAEVAASKPQPIAMPHQEQGGTRPADNMYSLQEHAAHRWGMVVDLDLCTGCSACAVACYAENNIPVVGRDELMLGRELSWIRIEPHLFGEGANERIQFLPVMCQQCDNAPCESVCPVFASSHTTDGLNAQIYNRCIGTRYCANNCPYKVRRFNYFDYEREQPGNQQLNPDVTVRSRGVMEKCTFCIQRIRDVQNRRKVAGRELADGEIVPACVQTCPTGALSFGDFKQEGWKMSRLARDPRGYRLLDYMVNTRPGVVYLRRVLSDDEGDG